MSTVIRYLGHAGFIVEHAGVRLLIDPWFYGAFLESWFPLPDNRPLLAEVAGTHFDYLYVSHAHEDHFDARLLRQLDRDITVLAPRYRSNALLRRFKELGYSRIIPLEHRETFILSRDFAVSMYLDTSHKEDSGVLLDMSGFRFLDLNDCNTPISELPTDVDLLAAQFSGAMWYPNCYDYSPEVMARKVKEVREGLLDTLVRKVRLTGARVYLPSAGPACFLDPVLDQYNDPDTTIFPRWADVAADFEKAVPGIALPACPGDLIHVAVETRSTRIERTGTATTLEPLDVYRERRRSEWEAFYHRPDAPVTQSEIESYFSRLQRRNKPFLHDFRKSFHLIADRSMWSIHLGRISESFVIEAEEPFDPEYTLVVSLRVLRAIVEGRIGWEEALLSMRIGLHRDPDVFDLKFMGLLRYGNEPVQTLHMLREEQNTETVERDGLRMQRFCPHAGEDLRHAVVCGGVIECPRHHWRWDALTGQCISGGAISIKVDVIDAASAALQRTTDTVDTAFEPALARTCDDSNRQTSDRP